MKKLILASAVAAALAAPTAVMAQAAPAAAAPASPHTVTGNVGVFSQYVFRGLTQTNEKPALQGGVDYSHSSGFYAGAWGSNISWYTEQNVGTLAVPVPLGAPGPQGAPYVANKYNSASLEMDFYGGFKNTFGESDFGYDVGLLQYYYPGTYDNLGGNFAKPDTLEVYGALSWKWLSFKYSQSTGDAFGVKNSTGSNYMDLSAAIPLGETGFTLGLHYGRQAYKGTSPVFVGTSLNNNLFTYDDYKISVTKEWLGATWSLAATGSNAKDTDPTFGAVYRNVYGKNIGASQFVLGVAKTF